MSAASGRRFAHGDHYAVSTASTTVLLPGQERELAAELWRLADAGAGFAELLDRTLAAGLSRLSSFALVEHGEDGVRVLVRGDFTASVRTADGERVVSAPDRHVWVEEVLPATESVVVGTVSEGPGVNADLPLTAGIVRAAGVVVGADGQPPTEQGATEQGAAAPVSPGPEPEPRPQPVPELAPEPEPQAEPEPEVPAAAPTTPSYGGMVAAPPGVEPDREGSTDDEAPTFVSEMPDFARPAVPGEQQPPAVVPRPVAVLVFSTGEVVEVDRTVLVGRAPEARRFAADDQPVLVTVASPHQEISSTHLEVRPGAGADHGSAVVTDLGSTNGTIIVQPGLSPEELQPGIAMSLVPGAVLDLGDGVTIQVTNP